MKHWKETAEIYERIARLPDSGRRAAMATVIRVQGSSYRKAGAKFLVEDDGSTLGSISGGCLEADVREIARAVLREGVPRRLRYDTGGDDVSIFGLGLGCSGTVDLFIQPVSDGSAPGAIDRVRALLDGDRVFAVCTVVGGSAAAGRVLVVSPDESFDGSTGEPELDREVVRRAIAWMGEPESAIRPVGTAEVFAEILTPPPGLVLFGAGEDTRPLCAYAADAGFRVTVVDHRESLLSASRFPAATRRVSARPADGAGALSIGPRSYAVVKTHSFGHDRDWVRELLAAGAHHVGVLGPRARTDEILRQLGAEDARDRVFGPVGLDLGAEGAEQIALSIVAELLAIRSAREPVRLGRRDAKVDVAS
jgi:xanthine dehydrogenase accessory factor